MTIEEKQALIEDCKREIAHFKRCIEAYPDAPVLKSDLMRQEIALAALTAQPVKLEPIIQIGYTHDEITCMCNIRNDDIKAIRAAGYEVIE